MNPTDPLLDALQTIGDNITGFGMAAGAAFGAGYGLTQAYRFGLMKGWVFTGEIVCGTTDYFTAYDEDGKKLGDQFMDTTGAFTIKEMFHDAARSWIGYIRATKKHARATGNPNLLAHLDTVLAHRLPIHGLSRDEYENSTYAQDILAKRAYIKGQICRTMINYIRKHIDTTAEIFDGSPLPDSLKDKKLIHSSEIKPGMNTRPAFRTLHPILTFEPGARVRQYRLMLIRDFQLNAGYLPERENTRIHTGQGQYAFSDGPHIFRHDAMSHLIEDLTKDEIWITDPRLEKGGKTMAEATTIMLKTGYHYEVEPPETAAPIAA